MFGMGFFEIFAVIVVAIIFLGPDKLPQAMIDLAKFFKTVKKTLDDAKSSLDKELNIEELKKEALEYKSTITENLDYINSPIQSILDDEKPSKQPIQDALNAQSLKDKEQHQLKQETQRVSLTHQIQEVSYKTPPKES